MGIFGSKSVSTSSGAKIVNITKVQIGKYYKLASNLTPIDYPPGGDKYIEALKTKFHKLTYIGDLRTVPGSFSRIESFSLGFELDFSNELDVAAHQFANRRNPNIRILQFDNQLFPFSPDGFDIKFIESNVPMGGAKRKSRKTMKNLKSKKKH